MKNHIFLIIVFCCISNITDSMQKTFDAIEINLDKKTADKLLKISVQSVSKAKPGYWPEDAVITLAGFYLVKDEYQNTANPRYAVRLTGEYVENENILRRATNGVYRKNEFDALGFNVPEDTK